MLSYKLGLLCGLQSLVSSVLVCRLILWAENSHSSCVSIRRKARENISTWKLAVTFDGLFDRSVSGEPHFKCAVFVLERYGTLNPSDFTRLTTKDMSQYWWSNYCIPSEYFSLFIYFHCPNVIGKGRYASILSFFSILMFFLIVSGIWSCIMTGNFNVSRYLSNS